MILFFMSLWWRSNVFFSALRFREWEGRSPGVSTVIALLLRDASVKVYMCVLQLHFSGVRWIMKLDARGNGTPCDPWPLVLSSDWISLYAVASICVRWCFLLSYSHLFLQDFFFFLLLQEEESHSLLTSSFTALQIKKQPWYFLRDDLHEFNEGLMGR